MYKTVSDQRVRAFPVERAKDNRISVSVQLSFDRGNPTGIGKGVKNQ